MGGGNIGESAFVNSITDDSAAHLDSRIPDLVRPLHFLDEGAEAQKRRKLFPAENRRMAIRQQGSQGGPQTEPSAPQVAGVPKSLLRAQRKYEPYGCPLPRQETESWN